MYYKNLLSRAESKFSVSVCAPTKYLAKHYYVQVRKITGADNDESTLALRLTERVIRNSE